ncbi:hypothetical protein EW026_g7573 [Hermanssonia centrifuga]|uniref:Uncharacterized protein n=1 Tax=Hermanssonia centrifuga TaxID=98765 RepID=A0A4S4K7D3_9APHY|nr:hypothetical protein EW026_g7573 [Hermanssonia centrifuga]
MATLGYSSFFSSGLLAADDQTTPRSSTIPLDDATPTAHEFTIPPHTADRPRIRRRRSSLGISASPVSAIKSSARSVHLQRQSLGLFGTPGADNSLVSRVAVLSANTNNDATMGNSLMGRLRSGSLGAALKYVSSFHLLTPTDQISRPRRPRKNPSVPAAAPAPIAPLPAVPPTLSAVSAQPIPVPRRPLNRRAQTADSLPSPLLTPTISMSRAHTPAGQPMNSPLASGAVYIGMDGQHAYRNTDYPSPLDTPASMRDEYFGADAGVIA